MRIVYNIAGMYRPSGMERVLADKANWLTAHGHEVFIFTTEQKGRPIVFPLDKSIRVVDFGIGYEDNNGSSLWDKIIHYPGKQRKHRKALAKALMEIHPDITISMFCNEVNFLPSIKDGSHKLLEVHFSRFKRLQYGREGLWAIVDRFRSWQEEKQIKKYERFVVLTEEDKNNWGESNQIVHIPNFVSFHNQSPATLDTRIVMAIGRFTHQKGLERLIEAWYLVITRLGKDSGWILSLVGDGELREELQSQISRLGLTDSVILGHSELDMEKVYRGSSILALSSRYEGFGLVLIEAQAFGVPAVAFACQCGPRDIITDGENGILVPEGDVVGLADGLIKLMTDDDLRKRMGRNAWENAFRWEAGPIMEQWMKLFEEVLSQERQ